MPGDAGTTAGENPDPQSARQIAPRLAPLPDRGEGSGEVILRSAGSIAMQNADVTRDEVHEALSHLYESDLLAQTPLAARLPGVRDILPLEKRAERMRALMLEAIEVLRPSRRPAFGSAESRHYDVLCLHYIEDMPVTRMQEELSIGRRQLHRDLLEAEARLAEVIASRVRATVTRPPSLGTLSLGSQLSRLPLVSPKGHAAAAKDPLSDELMLLNSQPEPVDLGELVQSVFRLLQPLAEQLDVRLRRAGETPEGAYALADRAILRQLLVQFIGYAIQAAPHGEVVVSIESQVRQAQIAVRFPSGDTAGQWPGLADARRIALSQQIHADVTANARETAILLRLPGAEVGLVLVVEDNIGAIELYRRSLSPAGWQVEGVSDPRLAFEVAASRKPDVIILDIMMPGLDGWGVLESLAASPETAAIPVIICSVVQDISLGKALGAKAYLRKPVSRGELVAALNQCSPSRQGQP